MFKSGWTVVGLGVLFVIIQSCGDEMGTGRIMTPGASGEPGTESSQTVTPTTPAGAGPEAEWPSYNYDDGREMWDGSAPIELEGWHWNQGVTKFRGQDGKRYAINCIPNGSEFAVWGTNPYLDDSPVCSAGAHLGLFTRKDGGRVVIEIRPAQRSYKGLDANGVASFPWGPYPGSFVVIK